MSGMILRLDGRFVMRAWRRGELKRWMQRGASLAEAMVEAYRRNCMVRLNVSENLVVNAGLYMAGDMLIGVVTTGLTYHAIGTGTAAPVAGNTTLGTEVARQAISARSRSSAIISLTTFYVAADCTYFVKEVGIFGNAATGVANSGTLFSHALLSEDNSAGLNDLTYDYELTIANG